MRENMVACLLLLFFISIFIFSPAAAVARAGFISIACCAKSNITDPRTTIAYISDDYLFDNVGICKNVASSTITSYSDKTARVFGNDNQARWCYNLPVTKEQEYLVRATFLGGPFFRSMNGTSFNVSFGSTSISQIDSSHNWTVVEGVFTATENHANICLVRGIGNAYISELELRPINYGTYLHGNPSSILKLVSRVDLGNEDFAYRYPIDLADRIWEMGTYITGSTSLSSSKITPQGVNISMPIEVLQTAVVNAERLQFLHADLDIHHYDYVVILYFLELDASVQTGERIFDVYINGDEKFHKIDILETGRASNYREVSVRVKLNGYLNISLVKASDKVKYGPICNAYEIFQVHQKAAETLERDATAMLNIRDELKLNNPRNEILEKWHEDPCLPSPWERLSCEEMNSTLVVTMLDLSFMNLQGPLPTAFSDLKEIKELDLQRNNFSGSIPDSFTSLQNLLKLSVGCNPSLNSQLPHGLSGLQNLTINSESCASLFSARTVSQRNVYVVGTVAGGSIACSIILGVFFTCFYRRARPNKKELPAIKNLVFSESSIHDPHDSYLNPVVQSFSLQYIKRATCHYSTMIGEGGFGAVYRGTLPQGQEVAVKVRSSTSTQGTREFNNEVTLLSAIRHENLVPLLGYCCEYDHQILVYPFMSNGSLQDRLYGEASKRKVLDWPTRLSIALGAARGLMYLHSFAGRCIIHRDVKSSNILLDDSMCGKVADFGFSKYAPQEGDSAASLEVRGTAGYLDPEYYSTQQLSAKSDVFSFGVVLLEIVTGREPLNIHRPRNEWSLVEWAKPFIRESRIDEIVDPSIKGGYHAEAMWRVVEGASACVENLSAYRPNMIDIVRELEDALIIENNASEYMKSIESFGGSNRFGSSNRFGGSNRFASSSQKSIAAADTAATPAPSEPSPNYCQTIATPLPR